jgi:transcriptional regulator GlxA family with amidase domain
MGFPFHNIASKAFEVTTVGAGPKVLSDQGVVVGPNLSFKEAYDQLDDYDVLVILGGNSANILKEKAEPLKIVKAYSDLQMKDNIRERTLMSICTGSLFLAEQGILSGLAATTHSDYMTAFENICSHSAVRDGTDRTDVDEEARYVVNNLRFDLGDEDENPYIRRKSDAGQRPSAGARYVCSFHCETL